MFAAKPKTLTTKLTKKRRTERDWKQHVQFDQSRLHGIHTILAPNSGAVSCTLFRSQSAKFNGKA